ncbi:MAG: bifunctional DNA primase/polymerase [Phycisphaerae bacterium]|nr:bifunctional DNA primase/polymerase [Phycisphaerae bacterium]
MDNILKQTALTYSRNGWAVLPCVCKEKKPATKHGVKDASINIDKIEKWWGNNSQFNIGIATGPISGFFVLDVDGPHGKETLTSLEGQHGKLPETVVAETKNGWHLYFQMPAGIDIRNRQSFRPGLDVRGSGGYVLAPPSMHPSGIRYQWKVGCGPGDVKIAVAPEWLIDMIIETKKQNNSTLLQSSIVNVDIGRSGYYDQAEKRASAYLACVEPAVQGQGGHTQLLKAVIYLVNGFALDPEVALKLLEEEYNPRCIPPWDLRDPKEAKDFRRKVDQVVTKFSSQPKGWLLNDKSENIKAGAEMAKQLLDSFEGYQKNKDNKKMQKNSEKRSKLKVIQASDIQMRPIRWLMKPMLAVGHMCILASVAGVGKSLVTIQLAAIISRGDFWPWEPNEKPPVGDVLILAGEDSLQETIGPRLKIAGADLERIRVVESTLAYDDKKKSIKERMVSLETDIDQLREYLKKYPEICAFIVDPISTYLGDCNMNRCNEVRSILQPLCDLAREYDVALLVVHHNNKSLGGEIAAHQISGSTGFVDIARTAFSVRKDPEQEGRCLILPVKSNISKDNLGFAYRIESSEEDPDIPVVKFENEYVEMHADDMMKQFSYDDKGETDVFYNIVRVVNDLLSGDEAKSLTEIKEAVVACCGQVSDKRIRKALKDVGAITEKQSFEGGWVWKKKFDAKKATDDMILASEQKRYGSKDSLFSS